MASASVEAAAAAALNPHAEERDYYGLRRKRFMIGHVGDRICRKQLIVYIGEIYLAVTQEILQ
jgi:hypothetical protein